MLVYKKWQNVAHVLHNNRIKFPKDNRAAVTSCETENNSVDLKEANLQDIRQYSNRPKRAKKRGKTITWEVSIVLISVNVLFGGKLQECYTTKKCSG